MQPFSTKIRIYIEDTDAGGIVYYVNYLKYMERCRTEWLRSLGCSKAATLSTGELIIVKCAEIDYQSPALLDDEITVTAEAQKIARTYAVLKQTVLRGETLLCEGEIKIACVKTIESKLKPCPFPPNMVLAFQNIAP